MPIEANLLLASFVAVQNANLIIVGAGWMVRAPSAAAGGPMAVAVLLQVPRDQFGGHQVRLELLDNDGQIVTVDPPEGPGPMIFEDTVEAGGLDSPAVTVPVTVPFAINLPPVPLARGSEFRWRMYVDGETRPSWMLPFRTTPPASPKPRTRA
jgi:hypothetical protein